MPKWAIEETMVWMRVGDSMFVPTLDPRRLKNRIVRYAKKVKFGVTVMDTVENYIKGVRVWRDY